MSESEAFEFDVAVSFAGEDRAYVESVVRGLPSTVRVFYDKDYKVQLWGEDLVEVFSDVYRRRSRYVVIFVSSSYAAKMWTNLERRSALARAVSQSASYVLPVRLDGTELPGLLPTVSYLDAETEGTQGVVSAIVSKLESKPTPTQSYPGGIARTPDQVEQLLRVRPPYWEYWLYGGLLLQGRQALETKYRDYELGYARPTGKYLQGQDAWDYLASIPDRSLQMMEAVMAIISEEAQLRAFGAPGEEGDADRITHLAQRFLDLYEGYLDLASTIRGTSMPDHFKRARASAAMFNGLCIAEMRRFIDMYVTDMDDIQSRVVPGEQSIVEMTLKFEIDPKVSEEFTAGMQEATTSMEP